MSDIIFERGAEKTSLLPPKTTSSSGKEDKHFKSNGIVIATTRLDNQYDVSADGDPSNQNQQTNGHVNSLEPKWSNLETTTTTSTTTSKTTTKKKLGFLSQFKGRTRYVLILCSLANFLACCAFSLLGPFYPLEAEKKGMSLTLIGFVFSVFQLVIFIASPVVGNYLTKIGAKFVYISGIFVGGSCVILFGVLDKCPNGTPFIVMSILCRSVEALGIAAFVTASFAIVSNECRESVGSAFAILESSSGLGFMVGPAIGGTLYQLGGYGLPFYVMGTLILLNGVLVYNYLPDPESVEKKRKKSMGNLFRSPLIVFMLVQVFNATVTMTMFDSTFAMHMNTYGVSTLVIGFIFIIPPTVYALFTPFWGYLTDHQNHPKTILLLGNLLSAIGYFFIGPSPVFPFLPSELWFIIIGLLLIGFSFGMLLIPSMKLLVVGAYELKYEASMDTYGLISGVFNSVNSFGGFVGPMAGAAIVQKFGHRVGFTVFSFSSLLMMVLGLVYFLLRHIRGEGRDEIGSDERNDGRDGDESELKGENDETTALVPSQGSNATDLQKSSGEHLGNNRHLFCLSRSLSRSISIPDV